MRPPAIQENHFAFRGLYGQEGGGTGQKAATVAQG